MFSNRFAMHLLSLEIVAWLARKARQHNAVTRTEAARITLCCRGSSSTQYIRETESYTHWSTSRGMPLLRILGGSSYWVLIWMVCAPPRPSTGVAAAATTTTATADNENEKKSECEELKTTSTKTCFWLEFKAHREKWHAPGCSGKHISVRPLPRRQRRQTTKMRTNRNAKNLNTDQQKHAFGSSLKHIAKSGMLLAATGSKFPLNCMTFSLAGNMWPPLQPEADSCFCGEKLKRHRFETALEIAILLERC